MNNILRLPNRDHAYLRLEQKEDSDIWELKVDPQHKYCLEYMRMGGDYEIIDSKISWKKITMLDPSGGPYMEVGDTLMHEKYEIVEILNSTTLRLHERVDDNEEHT